MNNENEKIFLLVWVDDYFSIHKATEEITNLDHSLKVSINPILLMSPSPARKSCFQNVSQNGTQVNERTLKQLKIMLSYIKL